ncbi:hypothetical protein [Gandjariella thermophila]|uniref:Uncharacterized protein n=1 Tax=Gandjariella thermophila TaxID=1931992 RepID=A0A4D4IY43_9PSEU|nr:hypothetical protein [Gandjariella thermophila]GDY29305.1 hypothetical protein GTS_09380 [Gandjariella thermophila]
MESDVVSAVRRRLESQATEQAERLELASRQLAETRKRTEEHNQKFVHDVHRLVQRLRESNAARRAAGRGSGGTLSFRAEDADQHDEFPGPVARPRPATTGAPDEEPGSVLRRAQERPQPPPVPQSPPAAQAPERARPAPPRRVPPRRPPVDDGDDDFSDQSWLR